MNGVFARARRFTLAVSHILRTGRPVVVIVKPYVFKMAFRSVGIRQLTNEVRRTRQAATWAPYTGHVIPQSRWSPLLAVSRFLAPDDDPEATMAAMIAFVTGRLTELERAPRVSVRGVLGARQVDLGLDRPEPRHFADRYQDALVSDYFDFQVPRTTMHGDFAPDNAVLHDGHLYLIDWEYASEGGSVLYDAWFLRQCLLGDEPLPGPPDKQVAVFLTDLERALTHVELRPNQFDAFGRAMHALVDFSRHVLRGQGVPVLERDIGEMERHALGTKRGGDVCLG